MQQTAHHKAPTKLGRFSRPTRNIGALRIQPGMKVADFGAGSGVYTLAIAEILGGSGQVYAIDVQQDLLRRIRNEADRRKFKSVEIIWGDLENPGGSKLADELCDVVLVSNLLFQLPDKRTALREARRIVKNSGRLAIIDWGDSFGGMGPIEEHVLRKNDASKIASECGFEFTHEFPAGAHHYGLIFRPTLHHA